MKQRDKTPPGQAVNKWAEHLTDKEKDFLQAIGGFIHVNAEPDRVGRYTVVVEDNNPGGSCTRYCFLNGPPWVYCCEAGP